MSYSFINAQEDIKKSLKETLEKLNYKSEINLEIPPKNMGDFAFPCFSLAPIFKKSPDKIAEEIFKNIKKSTWIEKIQVKGGYVNFFLNKEKLKKSIFKSLIEKKDEYGFLDKKNKKVIIEHTSANPNGPLHVGRARNPIIGDTIVRIYKAAGYNVESQFYLDDMGKQVAILTWGVNNIDEKDISKSEYDKADHKNVSFYQKASNLMQDDFKINDEIGEIVKKSEEGDNKTIEMIHKAYAPVLDGMKESMKRINITVDSYIPESNFVKDKSVDIVVEKLKKSKYCSIVDGAYYLDLEDFGVHGRNTKFFFLRKDGTTLYATRDIAYHLWKAKNADVLVNVLGEDHKLESKQVEIALSILNVKKIPRVIFYSFVSLPEGKMSTRRGRVVYLDDLIDESINRAYNEVKKRRGSELSDKKLIAISNTIGIAALRYNIIKVQPEKDFIFKWEDALNFEGNAAPFIQYSHARACSILRKNKNTIKKIDTSLLNHESEMNLIKTIGKFPLIIDDACKGCKPHIITTFLFELASLFNQFYRDCPVLQVRDSKLKNARLGLVDAARIVLKNGLNLLGIIAPKEM